MNPSLLILKVERLGAKLWVEGERLELDLPDEFPDDLVELLRQHKNEVLAHLRSEPDKSDKQMSPLLVWAAEVAEQCLELKEPLTFVETELRTVMTKRVSFYASRYLGTVSYARLQQKTGGWGRFRREWWQDRETDALHALANLKLAFESTGATRE